MFSISVVEEKKMCSITNMKGTVIRSTPDVCSSSSTRRLYTLKAKYADDADLLTLRENHSLCLLRLSRSCRGTRCEHAGNKCFLETKAGAGRYDQPRPATAAVPALRRRMKPKAILTPVSDATSPTTEKVMSDFSQISPWPAPLIG